MFNAFRPFFHIGGLYYGKVNGLCRTVYDGVNTDKAHNFLVTMLTRGLMYLLAIFITVIAYKRAISLTRSLPEGLLQAYNLSSKRLLLYPVAQFITFLPNFVYIFISIWLEASPVILVILMSLQNLSGLGKTLVYGGLLIQKQISHSRAYTTRSNSNSDSIYLLNESMADHSFLHYKKISEEEISLCIQNKPETELN